LIARRCTRAEASDRSGRQEPGHVHDTQLRTLAEVEPGEQAVVRRVPDRDRELLGYLASIGVLPGETVRVVAAEPSGGPLLVETGGAGRAISRKLAALTGIL
jgi:DtxR family Mn-dependent transcriptional regulator